MSAEPLQRSRQLILETVGRPADLTLIRGHRGPGDELVRAGARRLLGDRRYAEVGLQELCRASGDTALLALGDGLSRPRYGFCVRALAVAEARFERVIVLPTAVDPSEDAVHHVLSRTRATVFAGDSYSHRMMTGLCDARLAHHLAFFADYERDRRPGHGILNAFRTDAEQRLDVELPPANDDISRTRESLDAWTAAIAAHALIRTDRPQIMIAAALMGKRVEYAPDFDERLRGLAQDWLAGRPVSAIAHPGAREQRSRPLPAPLAPVTARVMKHLRDAALARPAPVTSALRPTLEEPRVTVCILSRNRARLAVRALDSLEQAGARHGTLVIDANSSPVAAAALAATCRGRDRLRFVRLERSVSAAEGRQLGAELISTELVLFLDDDAELLPGALAHLIADLDAHPEAGAVTGTVIDAAGVVMHSGGDVRVGDEVVNFSLLGAGMRHGVEVLPPSGPADWLGTTALLTRTELLREFPMDTAMSAYFEDNEWCYRVFRQRPGSFRRSREALALHQSAHKPVFDRTFAGRSFAVEWLAAMARFYEVHGLLLGPWLFGIVPELRRPEGTWDLGGARLIMDLVLDKGTDWIFAAWMNGGLEGLLHANRHG